MLVLRGSPRLAFRERFALNFLWMAGVLYWLGAAILAAGWHRTLTHAASSRDERLLAATMAGGILLALVWRRCAPASYAKHYAPLHCALRLGCVQPGRFRMDARFLSDFRPCGAAGACDGAPAMLRAAVVVVFASGIHSSLLSWLLPASLGWAVLSQTAVSWVHVAHAHTACSCAALASAPLRDLFRGAFVMLNSLTSLLLLGVPPGPTLESMPATGQCAAVLTYLQLGLGLVAPALVQAALEAHLFRQHQAQRARQGLPPERGAHARLYAWVAAALSAAPEELLIVAAAWLGVCLLWSASLALSSLAAPGQ